jgi:large subunit ribosomal protein L17
MRHRKRGRHLGRSPSHQRALLRNLASALFLTERETDKDIDENIPAVKGRITTTLQKAKEVRPLVEKCITIAVSSLEHEEAAEQFATTARRNTDAWKDWRQSETYQKWNQAKAPAVTARRRVLRLIGDKQAVRVLFETIAPRFTDRAGGYTRILKLPRPRLGDAGARALLEFVGVHDRKRERAQKPQFETTGTEPAAAAPPAATESPAADA